MVDNKNYDELIKYNDSIFEYDNEVSKINKSYSLIEGKGYLINKEDFNELKGLLNFTRYKTHVMKDKNFNKNSFFKNDDIKQIKKLETIKIKSVDYIKNKVIYNNKEIILITEKLKDLISNKYEKLIKFEAKKEMIILFINNEQLELKHNNLILSFQRKVSENDEIKEINDSMWKYFTFENKIIEQLSQNELKSGSGLLVRKNWLDKWKKYTNYEYFKENYLVLNCDGIPMDIKKSLFNEIIDYREAKKSNYLIPSENDILIINNENEITNILKNTQLAIIDSSFKNFFPYFKTNANEIKYHLCNGEIIIKLKNKIDLIFKANDNILLFENIIQQEKGETENELDNKDLKQLIKIFCFQRSFPDIDDKYYKNSTIQKDNIILINKYKIQKYKDNFNYSKLIIHLEKIINNIKKIQKNGKVIDYDSLNDKDIEQIISQLINKEKYNFSNKNQNNQFLNNYLTFKINKTKDYDCDYIDYFELINEDIANFFLYKKIISNKDIIKGEIIIDNKNIALIFSYLAKNYYEFGYLNSNKDFIIESIIKENYNRNNKFKNDVINNLNDGIQKFFG